VPRGHHGAPGSTLVILVAHDVALQHAAIGQFQHAGVAEAGDAEASPARHDDRVARALQRRRRPLRLTSTWPYSTCQTSLRQRWCCTLVRQPARMKSFFTHRPRVRRSTV